MTSEMSEDSRVALRDYAVHLPNWSMVKNRNRLSGRVDGLMGLMGSKAFDTNSSP